MATVPPPADGYEFTEAQNVEFISAATWMEIMAWASIVFGGLSCLSILVQNVPGLIGGLILVVSGVWTHRAAAAFHRVATTTGRDIDNVMEAVANLKKLYRLQVVLLAAYFAMVIVFVILIELVGIGK